MSEVTFFSFWLGSVLSRLMETAEIRLTKEVIEKMQKGTHQGIRQDNKDASRQDVDVGPHLALNAF